MLQVVAAGTFGAVCAVRDPATGERFAAKVLKAEHTDNPRVLARMRDEAAVLARLDVRGIIRMREIIEVGDRPVLLLDWVEGANLEEILTASPGGLSAGIAFEIVREAAASLHQAWTTVDAATAKPIHIIHRDIKPSNLLVSVDGRVLLVDFGTATGQFAGRESETVSMVLGARAYVAPERLDGSTDHPAADVYSLGHVLYEALAGRPLQLSMHPLHHERLLADALMSLSPQGVTDQVLGELRGLIRRMVAYDAALRPHHHDVAGVLEGLASMLPPASMGEWAAAVVRPLSDLRAQRPPRKHPHWVELAFLEGTEGRAADDRIRAFLRGRTGSSASGDLNHLLDRNPGWTSAPFVEALEATRTWWHRWVRRTPPDHLAMLLEPLLLRPDERARQVASAFVGHGDPAVARLANRIFAGLD